MNTDKNTALYEKMAAEQDKFRDWLKSQPPEEILKHTYEYTVREDILMAMEEPDVPFSGASSSADRMPHSRSSVVKPQPSRSRRCLATMARSSASVGRRVAR